MWSLYHTETNVMGFLAKMGSAGPGQAGQCPEGRCPEEKGFQSTLVKFGQGAGPHRQPKAVPPSGPAPPPTLHRAVRLTAPWAVAAFWAPTAWLAWSGDFDELV